MSAAGKTAVMVAIGTRPEAIKLAPVVLELKRRGDLFRTVVVATAQHREISDEVLETFGITPEYDLDIMRTRQSPPETVARVLSGMTEVLEVEKPEACLVQGDTSTTFAAALATFYRGVRVGHVEAGLRTGDMRRPFPEEANRRLTSVLAEWHFAPTDDARSALLAEGISPSSIHLTGNTVVDALLTVDELGVAPPAEVTNALEAGRRVVLVTLHRRESWGRPAEDVCDAIAGLVGAFEDIEVVFAVHPNPAVREDVRRALSGTPRVHLLGAVPYASFVAALKRATLVLSDSGGIQEEAPTFGVPVLVLRELTERPEAVRAGTARVIGTDVVGIRRHAADLLSSETARKAMASDRNPFGDGHAAERIVDVLAAEFRAPD